MEPPPEPPAATLTAAEIEGQGVLFETPITESEELRAPEQDEEGDEENNII